MTFFRRLGPSSLSGGSANRYQQSSHDQARRRQRLEIIIMMKLILQIILMVTLTPEISTEISKENEQGNLDESQTFKYSSYAVIIKRTVSAQK